MIAKEKILSLLEKIRKTDRPLGDLPLPFNLFGIECGNGWLPLLIPILEYILKYNEEHPGSEITITQIKEKYGELRVYVDHGTDELYDLIDDATEKSCWICEECGKPGETKEVHGWLYTRCDECLKKLS